jgi:hypothetical protein
MIERQIDRPMPMPLDLVVKKASNRRSASLAAIPTPQSSTATEFDRAVLLRSDHQFARPSDERLHRFNAIDHQIKDHLLELDPICKDQGQGWSEFHLQRNSAAPQLMLHQRDNFVNDVIDVGRYFPRGCLVHEGMDGSLRRPDRRR